jgi:hypothetical protein
MKYNTLRDYMGGGRNMPMSYISGGARNILGRARLSRKGMELEDKLADLSTKATSARDRILGFGKAGTGLLTLLAPRILDAVAPGAGVATSALLKGALAGIGRFAGEKLGDATAEKVDAGEGTGFGTQAKQDIEDYRESLGEGSAKRALGAGAGTALMSGLGDLALDKAGDLFDKAKYKVKGAIAKSRAGDYVDPATADFGASFKEGRGMYGDLPIEDLEFIDPSEKAYYESLGASRLMGLRAGEIARAQDTALTLSDIGRDIGSITESLPSRPALDPSMGVPLEDITFGGSSGMNIDDKGLVNLLYRTTKDPEEVETVGYNTRDVLTELLKYTQPPRLSTVDVFGENLKEGGMMRNYAGGGKLKQVPQGNRGLAKLPEAVRNKMGYMMQGGMMDDYMGGGMMDMYMYGGMAKKKKKSGYMGGGMTMGRGLIDMMPFKRRIV